MPTNVPERNAGLVAHWMKYYHPGCVPVRCSGVVKCGSLEIEPNKWDRYKIRMDGGKAGNHGVSTQADVIAYIRHHML